MKYMYIHASHLGLLQTWGMVCFGAGVLLVFTLLLTERGHMLAKHRSKQTTTDHIDAHPRIIRHESVRRDIFLCVLASQARPVRC